MKMETIKKNIIKELKKYKLFIEGKHSSKGFEIIRVLFFPSLLLSKINIRYITK
ncbi:MAG TPA: hypothetical protein VGB37_01095 [Candidatus Lokiarchaeia archaeon]